MKVAIVNPITATVDMPEKKSAIVGLGPSRPKKDTETNIMELASRISERGNSVTVFISDVYRPMETSIDVGTGVIARYLKTRYAKIFPPAYIPYTPDLVDEISSNGFDIVQSGEFFQWGTILASKSTRRTNIPLVVWQEIDINPQFPGGFLQAIYNKSYGRMICRRISGFVPRSKSARRYLLNTRIPPDKICPIIHTGVNTQIFHPLEDQNLKEKYGFKSDSPLILSVGRLHPNKGYDILIRAVAKAREKIPNISLAIKGNGPQKDYLENLIRRLQMEDHTSIISEHISRKSMNELYNASDLTAISSRIDLFPFSAIESLACGKPIVSLFGRGVKLDVIGNHGTGMYVPNDSIRNFADSIVYLVRNPDVRLEMGRRALHLCRREFDLDVVSRRFCNLYRLMIASET
ncbi:MAG: glycosyltransferase family 4 protein [Thermoplasmata archaeon]|nr:glycosyltransferase family 4 protein [Thermoplasmata archaeon]